MAANIPIFETYDADLAAFLMLEGLKFIECILENPSAIKPRVIMRFFDEKEKARDLERVFLNSDIKKYRSLQKYLLKEIHRTIKGI